MTVRQISPWTRVATALVASALLVVATGCTRPADQQDTAGGQVVVAGGGGPATSTGASTGTGGTPTSAGGGDPIAAAIAAGDFGTLKHVCGPAPKGQVNKATGSQGVTADSMKIGTFSDPNNKARPGINQDLFDTADVFSAWCNGLGGIAGRKIEVVKHDSGLFNVVSTMADACRTDFYLVGGGSVLDDSGVKPRLQCLLPQISGFVVSNEARMADLQSQPQSVPADSLVQEVFRYLAATFPQADGKIGYLTGNLSTLITTIGQYKEAGAKLGWKTAYDEQYNSVGESTWVPYAQAIKQAGVRGLAYVGEPENLALLVQALANINYKLDWILGSPNMYDAKLTKAAGAALNLEPVYMGLGFPPFEYASKVPATAEFLALFKKFKPQAKAQTLLGVNAMSAWLLFAQSATACGADLTRLCVYKNSLKPTAWTAGGLWSPADLTDGVGGSVCSIVVKATPSGFTPIPWKANASGFNCDPQNVIKLRTKLPKPITLADVGKSLADVK